MKPRLSHAAAVLPLVFLNPAFAQIVTSFNPVVVSAARVEQPLSEVIPSVTVITREDIERAQSYMMDEVNWDGVTKAEGGYNWQKHSTRLTTMVHRHLHARIEEVGIKL